MEAFGTTLRGFLDGAELVSTTDTPTSGGSPTTTSTTPPPSGTCDTSAQPAGFASVNALGQNGTTGGAGGPKIEVDTVPEFLSAIATPGPLNICVRDMLALPGPMHDVSSDKTIVGIGANSGFTGGGLNIGLPNEDITTPPANAIHNVIVRNIIFRDFADDGVNVQMFSHHVWIDHNDLSNGFDGTVDIKRGSSYVTVSWNHTHSHTKNMLLGHDDSNAAQDVGRLKVTYHHNWYDQTPQRNPRVRFGEPVHVYNNYYFESVEEPVTNHYAEPGQPDCSGVVQEARDYYSYTLDDPNSVKAAVMAGAGVGRVG